MININFIENLIFYKIISKSHYMIAILKKIKKENYLIQFTYIIHYT